MQGTKWVVVVVVYKDCHTHAQMDAYLLRHARLGHPGDASMGNMMEQGFLDDATHWMWIFFFLKKKSEYLNALEAYVEDVRKYRSRLGLGEQCHMVLHTDGDNTMITGQTAGCCERNGIEQSKLNGKLPDLSGLRVFGCMVYAYGDPGTRDGKLSSRAQELRYVGHFGVSTAYLLYDPENEKVVRSGMVVFSERLDKLGAVVTSWDPSVLAPLKTNFTVTVLDAENVDESPKIHKDALLVGRSVYVPDGSDEVLAVLKLQQKQSVF
ncbi:hypothetical protein CYMTET_25416 [Cymbomonas tetramitiformis]|uniref:Retroviral polymerase SH3-like domain-containing protein n=1 Tax=Cymbomonas tetramitiformis TaxID=36881 RepID=A0AAE0KZ96_9CHLO|nr:hypothetical protein CYMTET_25416 [Cymbomonas tetramitiformis]